MQRLGLRLVLVIFLCLCLSWFTFKPAVARFQNNPQQVTLIDVLACLTLFQNPGQVLSAEQIASGVGGILGQTIPANSFNPVPSVAECDFIAGSPTGVDLADVIALLVAFQNPGMTLMPTQLASGVNGILGTTLTPTQVLRVPENGSVTPTPTPTPNNQIAVPGTVTNQLVTGDPDNPFRPGRRFKDFRLVGAVAGQRVQIDLSSSQFDTFLQIINPATGTVLLENDDVVQGNTNSRIILLVQTGIAYVVRVTSYDANETGSFTLSTQLLPTDGAFSIQLEFVDNGMTAAQQQLIRNAARRWEQLITGDLGPETLPNFPAGTCGTNLPPTNIGGRVINDVLIFVQTGLLGSNPSDGPSGTLANAGPCGFTRPGSRLISTGVAGFDPADLSNPLLLEVAVHELGHVLGIGTRWQTVGSFPSLITGGRFAGVRGAAEFQSYGGVGNPPVQQPSPGHWEENAFGAELMTPLLNSGRANPLSRVTLGALQDLGYSGLVYAGADPYTLGERGRFGDDVDLGDDIYIAPIFTPAPKF